jgi:hypothetical protein
LKGTSVIAKGSFQIVAFLHRKRGTPPPFTFLTPSLLSLSPPSLIKDLEKKKEKKKTNIPGSLSSLSPHHFQSNSSNDCTPKKWQLDEESGINLQLKPLESLTSLAGADQVEPVELNPTEISSLSSN